MEAFQRRRRCFSQRLERFSSLGGCEGSHHQARRLFRQRLGHRRMAMAEAGDRHPGEKIQVNVTVHVGERGAFAMIEGNARQRGNPLPAGSEVALLLFEQRPRAWPGNHGCNRGKFTFFTFHRWIREPRR
jgi:hypothetical protein